MTRQTQASATRSDLRMAERIGKLLPPWYERNGRRFPWRTWTDFYRLTVVEVLLQRTRAEQVEHHAGAFFDKYPTWEALAAARETELEVCLAPLGLHRRRSRALAALAQAKPSAGSRLDRLPGLGQYISRAVAVASSNASVAMVDSNFVRIVRRVFEGGWMSDYRYDRRLQELASGIIRGSGDPRGANWAILDLGAAVCRPRRPRCPVCPLASSCAARMRETARPSIDAKPIAAS